MAEGLRIITDEHVSRAVVSQLQIRGVDVVRVEDVLGKGTLDESILEYAAANRRTVLGFDDDFERLHVNWLQSGKSHCGIFRCMSNLIGAKGI